MAKDLRANIVLGGKLDGSLLKSMSAAEKQMALLNKTGGAIRKVAGTAMKAAGVAAVAAGAATVKIVKDSVEAGKNFDASMAQVAATMGKSVDEIADLRQFALDMGKSTMFSASQSADALNYMALAGYDAQTSMAMLPNVLNLAAAGNIDLAAASDMVTDAASALGLDIGQTTMLVDQMAKTASSSNTSVAQLGEAILTVGGTAKNLAGGTVELNAALGILANNGIKSAEGGTHLRNMLLSLQSPTSDAAAALEDLGVNVFDEMGHLNSLGDIFGQLNGQLSQMTDEEKVHVLSNLFNKTDLSAAQAMLAGTVNNVEDLKISLRAMGVASDDAALTSFTLQGGFDAVAAAAQEGADATVLAQQMVSEYGLSSETAATVSEQLASAVSGEANDFKKLTGQIEDATGAAEKMAMTQMDNLAGDITFFQSALEGAQITLSDAITPALREFVQFGTEELNKLTDVLDTDEFQTFADGVARDITGAARVSIQALGEIRDGFTQEFDATKFMDAVNGVRQAVGSAFGDGSEVHAASNFGEALADGLNLTADAIVLVTPLVGAAASAFKFLADNSEVVLPIIGGVAGAFVTISAVTGVAGVITTVAGALGVVGATGTAAGAGLTATAGGTSAAGAAAAASVGELLALGGAVLMVGAGVALAALGLGLLAQAAIAVASAGPGAAVGMIAMVAVIAGLAVGAAALGPALDIAAVGVLAFGGAILMIGAGVMLAATGIAALAGQLPTIATYGMSGGAGLMVLGAGLMVTGAGALVAGAGLVVATPALVAFSAVAAPAAAAIGLLSGAVGALSGPIVDSGNAVGTMGWGMQAMADNATAAAGGLTTLAAASAAASGPIAMSAPSMSALGSAAASSVGGTQAASAGIMAMMVTMMMLPGSTAAGMSAFDTFAAGVSSAMSSAQSEVSSACSSMQSTVNGMYLTIPTITVSALPHFSMSGEFNPETGAVPIVSVSYYARGGFTDGPLAIAGEAGREAVISFDPRYRSENIGYWYQAGEMLGILQPLATTAWDHDGRASSLAIDIAREDGSLARAAAGVGGRGGVTIDFGGVTFAPQITVSGTGKQDVLEQIRDAEDEFFDMLDEWARDKEEDYAPVF